MPARYPGPSHDRRIGGHPTDRSRRSAGGARAGSGTFYHGGVIASVIDTAGAAAAWSNHDFDRGARASTVTMSVQYVGAAKQSDLICTARTVRRRRELIFTEITATDADGSTVAHAVQTYRGRGGGAQVARGRRVLGGEQRGLHDEAHTGAEHEGEGADHHDGRVETEGGEEDHASEHQRRAGPRPDPVLPGASDPAACDQRADGGTEHQRGQGEPGPGGRHAPHLLHEQGNEEVTREKPPSSSVMVGKAVATMVPSRVLITWPSWTPTNTSSTLAPGRDRPATGSAPSTPAGPASGRLVVIE